MTVYAPDLRLPERDLNESAFLERDLEAFSPATRPQFTETTVQETIELCAGGAVDIVLVGCKVIGRSHSNEVEIVNSRPCVDLVRQSCSAGLPLVVTTGLYKIWPLDFYLTYRDSVVLAENSPGEQVNGVLGARDVQWILTERGCYMAANFGDEPLPRTLLDNIPLPITSALESCDSDTKILDIIHDDDIMESMSREVIERQPFDHGPDTEYDRYVRTRRLPSHFEEARRFYAEMLRSEQWYREYKGKYVAIMAHKVVDSNEDETQLLTGLRENFGERPIFTAFVARKAAPNLALRPRAVRRAT